MTAVGWELVFGANDVIRYGTLFSLVTFAVMVYLAYRQQKQATAGLKHLQNRLHRLSALVEAMGEEKKVISKEAQNKVDRVALQAVLSETADALKSALSPQVARAQAGRGRNG